MVFIDEDWRLGANPSPRKGDRVAIWWADDIGSEDEDVPQETEGELGAWWEATIVEVKHQKREGGTKKYPYHISYLQDDTKEWCDLRTEMCLCRDYEDRKLCWHKSAVKNKPGFRSLKDKTPSIPPNKDKTRSDPPKAVSAPKESAPTVGKVATQKDGAEAKVPRTLPQAKEDAPTTRTEGASKSKPKTAEKPATATTAKPINRSDAVGQPPVPSMATVEQRRGTSLSNLPRAELAEESVARPARPPSPALVEERTSIPVASAAATSDPLGDVRGQATPANGGVEFDFLKNAKVLPHGAPKGKAGLVPSAPTVVPLEQANSAESLASTVVSLDDKDVEDVEQSVDAPTCPEVVNGSKQPTNHAVSDVTAAQVAAFALNGTAQPEPQATGGQGEQAGAGDASAVGGQGPRAPAVRDVEMADAPAGPARAAASRAGRADAAPQPEQAPAPGPAPAPAPAPARGLQQAASSSLKPPTNATPEPTDPTPAQQPVVEGQTPTAKVGKRPADNSIATPPSVSDLAPPAKRHMQENNDVRGKTYTEVEWNKREQEMNKRELEYKSVIKSLQGQLEVYAKHFKKKHIQV